MPVKDVAVQIYTIPAFQCIRQNFYNKKTSHQMFRHMHGVLNEIYLQNFLHEWAVNRETNLMSLLNL